MTKNARVLMEEVTFKGPAGRLWGELWRRDGAASAPVILWNHGSRGRRRGLDRPRAPGGRSALEVWLSMGTAVFAPSRRGYDGAEGESVEEAVATAAFGSVIYHDLMIERLRAETEDVLIAFDLIRQQPWADPSRIVCAGYSLGAMVTIDALARESGLAAGVAFALAAIMWPASPAIRALVREQVASSCQPLMLVQAANDFSTEPSRALAPMISSRSNASRVAVYPPHGKRPNRAHAFCASGAGTWGQDVQRFLVDAGVLA